MVHPDYFLNETGMDNDISLLKLAKPIAFPSNNKIAPVCLPTVGETYNKVMATVTGWGHLTFSKLRFKHSTQTNTFFIL